MNLRVVTRQFYSIYKAKGLFFLVKYIFRALHDAYVKKYIFGSFSQKGEDLVIEKILGDKKKGFYIDVGAHNPTVYNNTKRFYEKGWSGINIEPNPILFKRFKKERKRDVNLNIGIGKKSTVLSFYEINPDSLSTFSKSEKNAKINLGYTLSHEYKIHVSTLKNVISKYVRNNIDFLSVDTEGWDLEVLQSNDWVRYRPRVVCVETGDFGSMMEGKKSNKKSKIDMFMAKNKYHEVYSNGLNSIYTENF